jgi:hypothetical protein
VPLPTRCMFAPDQPNDLPTAFSRMAQASSPYFAFQSL